MRKVAVQYLLGKKASSTAADRYVRSDDAFDNNWGPPLNLETRITSNFWWGCSISSDGRLMGIWKPASRSIQR